MPINLYERPAESNYFNTYVPIPFEEMAGVIGQKQKAYEINAAREDQFRDYLLDFKVGPGKDEQTYRTKMTELDEALIDLHDRVPDLSSIEYKTGLNKLIKGFIRDPWVRQAPQNREQYIQGAQLLAEAEGENDPWNTYRLKKGLEDFRTTGTEGLIANSPSGAGYLQLPGVTKKVNIPQALNSFFSNFQQEGTTVTYNDKTGEKVITHGRVGVPFTEVAQVAGFQFETDKDGRPVDLDRDGVPDLKKDENGDLIVNPNIALMNEIGSNLKNQALYLSEQNGEDPERMLNKLYTSMVLPKVLQHSGETITEKETYTSKGLEGLGGSGDFAFNAYSLDAKKIAKDADFSFGKQSTLWKLGNYLNSAFKKLSVLANPSLALVTKSTGLYQGKRYDKIEEFAKDIQDRKIPLEEGLEEIRLKKDAASAVLMSTNNFVTAGAIRTYYNLLEDLIKGAYYSTAPKELDERQKALYNKLQSTGTIGSISNKPYEQLTPREQNIAYKAFGKESKRFAEEGIHFTITNPANIELQKKAENALFDGTTIAKQVTGIALNYKVFDPQDPKVEMSLQEWIDKADKDARINWKGWATANNPYSGGLHVIQLGGKELLMQVTKITDTKGNDLSMDHPLYNRDWKSEIIPNLLFQYNFSTSGISDWFPQEDKQIRTVAKSWEYSTDEYGIKTYTAKNPQLQVKNADGTIEKIDFDPDGIKNEKYNPKGIKDRTIVDTYNRWLASIEKK